MIPHTLVNDELIKLFPLSPDYEILKQARDEYMKPYVKIPFPEMVKLQVCANIHKYMTTALKCNNLWNIDIMCCTDKQPDNNMSLFHYIDTTKSCKKIYFEHNTQLTLEKIRALDNDIAIFSIGLTVSDIKCKGAEGHGVSGFIDRQNKTIIIYDGAFWFCVAPEIEHFIVKHFREFFPDFSIQVICKSHQTEYGTCSMFQPTVVFLMILHGVEQTMSKLDSINGEEREEIIDSVALRLMKLFK